MTRQPQQSKETPPGIVLRRKWPVRWYVGWPVMNLGVVTATIFSVRQFKESAAGHTYYEFIIPGVVVGVIGFIMLVTSRPSRPHPGQP